MNSPFAINRTTGICHLKKIAVLWIMALSCTIFGSCIPKQVITAYSGNSSAGLEFAPSSRHCQRGIDPIVCLEMAGWQPFLQFVTYQHLDREDLVRSINACRTYLPAEFSAELSADLDNNASVLVSAKKVNKESFSIFEECLEQNNWLLITEKPWQDDGHQLQIIPPPATLVEPVQLAAVIRNESLAIFWAADIVDKALHLTYSEALSRIQEMNESAHSDRSDWRLPTEGELRIIVQSSPVTGDLLNPLRAGTGKTARLRGPYWADSGLQPDTALTLSIPGGERMHLPDSRPYVAHLLPVSGKGWGGTIPQGSGSQASAEAATPSVQAEVARFLRYSTSNRTPTPVAPFGR